MQQIFVYIQIIISSSKNFKMLSIYHNPRCSKSRQGLEIIKNSGLKYEVIEYLKENPDANQLRVLIRKLGIKPESLIRKGEADYKEHFEGKELSDQEWVQAMVDYPKLIERPIVVNGENAVVGRPPESIKEIL